MKIAEVYSHLNGWEYIKVHKPQLWDEIEEIIKNIDADKCKTKISKEKNKIGSKLYSPIDLNKEFKIHFEQNGWKESRVSYWVTKNAQLIRRTINMDAKDQKEEIEKSGLKPIRSYNQTDFVKDRIAVEIQFGKYAFVAYDLFVKHLSFYVKNVIDVGIEILPMKELQSQMSSGLAYYEGELYNLIREGRGVPAVPLVLIGIAS